MTPKSVTISRIGSCNSIVEKRIDSEVICCSVIASTECVPLHPAMRADKYTISEEDSWRSKLIG